MTEPREWPIAGLPVLSVCPGLWLLTQRQPRREAPTPTHDPASLAAASRALRALPRVRLG